jgi:hypothetical protein
MIQGKCGRLGAHVRASGLSPVSHPLLDRAEHFAFHHEVDGFEQER